MQNAKQPTFLCPIHSNPIIKLCISDICKEQRAACCTQCIPSHLHDQQAFIKLTYLQMMLKTSKSALNYQEYPHLIQQTMDEIIKQVNQSYIKLKQQMLKQYYLLIGRKKESNYKIVLQTLIKSNTSKIKQMIQLIKQEKKSNNQGYDPTVPYILTSKYMVKQLIRKTNYALDTYPFWKYQIKAVIDQKIYKNTLGKVEIQDKYNDDGIKIGFKALAEQAKALNASKDYDKAIKCANQAIQLNPRTYNGYFQKAYACFEKKQYSQAINNYQAVIELQSTMDIASNNRGLALNNLKKYREAVDSFDFSISKNPKYANAFLNKGVSYNFLQKLDQALACYNKAIELNDKYRLAYKNKAALLKKMGKYAQAQQVSLLERNL